MEKISCSLSSDIIPGRSNFIWANFLSPIKIHLTCPLQLLQQQMAINNNKNSNNNADVEPDTWQ